MGEFFFELRVYFQPPPFRYLYLPPVRCLRGGGMGTTEVLEEMNRLWREALLFHNCDEKLVVKGREELRDVKRYHASLELTHPPCMHKVG